MPEYIERDMAIRAISLFKNGFRDTEAKCVIDGCWIELMKVPASDVIEIGSCEGCYWKGKGRFQKCTYCRRNRNLKDRYLKEGAFDE